MTKKERHVVTIDNDGAVTIEVTGVKGKSCLKATKDIEEALGVVTERTLTKEAYERDEELQVKH